MFEFLASYTNLDITDRFIFFYLTPDLSQAGVRYTPGSTPIYLVFDILSVRDEGQKAMYSGTSVLLSTALPLGFTANIDGLLL